MSLPYAPDCGIITPEVDGSVQRSSRAWTAFEDAWAFLREARRTPTTDLVTFRRTAKSAIVNGRSALHQLEAQYKTHPQFKPWWDQLFGRFPILRPIMNQRDFILKEGHLQVHRTVGIEVGDTIVLGETATVTQVWSHPWNRQEPQVIIQRVMREFRRIMAQLVARGTDIARRWRVSRSRRQTSRIAYDAIYFNEPERNLSTLVRPVGGQITVWTEPPRVC